MPRPAVPISNDPGSTGEPQDPPGTQAPSATIEQLPVKPAPTMQHTELSTRKTRGRLSRNTLDTLGKVLEVFYDDVRKEGVPDRFVELLRQYEEGKDKGPH